MTDALPQKYGAQREMVGLSRETRTNNDAQRKYTPQSIEMYMTTIPSLENLRFTHETRLEYLRNWKK